MNANKPGHHSTDQAQTGADAPHGKPHYTGDTIDANTLKNSGNWTSEQAMWDAAYINYTLSGGAFAHVVKNDAVQSPRIANVQDNAQVQNAGWVDGSFIRKHPPTPEIAQIVDNGNAWAAANLHQGHKKHR